ncbi:hypothetical protein Ahy_B02g059115 isoform A [Arachis hypogaea]|uniref:Uncharacterized protein n=1 Tax=Arachis hypogaea TaxID=3818 RepID=A0A445AG41_ARAHY|nr:hypothetical protein Ahy_B02g059115 isoform A [Arachis hypogaea]
MPSPRCSLSLSPRRHRGPVLLPCVHFVGSRKRTKDRNQAASLHLLPRVSRVVVVVFLVAVWKPVIQSRSLHLPAPARDRSSHDLAAPPKPSFQRRRIFPPTAPRTSSRTEHHEGTKPQPQPAPSSPAPPSHSYTQQASSSTAPPTHPGPPSGQSTTPPPSSVSGHPQHNTSHPATDSSQSWSPSHRVSGASDKQENLIYSSCPAPSSVLVTNPGGRNRDRKTDLLVIADRGNSFKVINHVSIPFLDHLFLDKLQYYTGLPMVRRYST